ncbi:hypothetical protein HII13_004894 [Brettanomyces bruxellensis]|nr:hypothetical protein HII13_004894 [Brettanomyces bruxellensis]
MSAISFPEVDIPNSQKSDIIAGHRTLVYLIRLLKGTSYSVFMIYLTSIFVLRPLLSLKYERRQEFLQFAFERIKKLYSKVSKNVKHIPAVEENYNGRVYKDESVGTGDFLVKDYSFIPGDWSSSKCYSGSEQQLSLDEDDLTSRCLNSTDKLFNSMTNMKRTLEYLKVHEYKKKNTYYSGSSFRNKDDSSEMQPLLFQLKQLDNYMGMVNADHPRDYFFRRSPLQNLYADQAGAQRKDGNYLDSIHKGITECQNLIEQVRMVKPGKLSQ